MSLFKKAWDVLELTRLCTLSMGMTLLIIWGIWGWGMLTYWYLEDAPVVEFGQGTISNTPVKPFQSVVVRIPMKKFRNCEGTSTRYLFGECGHHILSSVSTVYQSGFVGEVVYPFSIPDTVSMGNCSFRVHVVYRCNLFDPLLHRQVVDSPSVDFVVTR